MREKLEKKYFSSVHLSFLNFDIQSKQNIFNLDEKFFPQGLNSIKVTCDIIPKVNTIGPLSSHNGFETTNPNIHLPHTYLNTERIYTRHFGS